MNATISGDSRTPAILYFILSIVVSGLFVMAAHIMSPHEDAAILFQYSKNLAESGVISYNLGGGPTEGATDFLWMVLLAILSYLYHDPFLWANILSALSLIFSGYFLFRLFPGPDRLLPVFLLIFLALTPQLTAGLGGFSVYFFGLFIILTILALKSGKTLLLALSCLTLCLIRPDGVIFAAPLALLHLFQSREQAGKRFLVLVIACLVPAIAYFNWRVNYFGHLLPLPFYVKSSVSRYFGLFSPSIVKNLQYLVICSPLYIYFLYQMAKQRNRIHMSLAVALVILPFLAYSWFHLTQNVSHRMQYPFLIIALAVSALAYRTQTRKAFYIALVSSMLLMLVPSGFNTLRYWGHWTTWRIDDIARDLGMMTIKGTIGTTEAGLLPFHSGWETVDLWGLNTPRFSKTVVQTKDIEELDLDLVVLHSAGSSYDWYNQPPPATPRTVRSWDAMVRNCYDGVAGSGYTLRMVPVACQPVASPVLRMFVDLYEKAQRVRAGRSRFPRYDMWFVKRTFAGHDDLVALLDHHHAVVFDQYLELRQLDIPLGDPCALVQ